MSDAVFEIADFGGFAIGVDGKAFFCQQRSLAFSAAGESVDQFATLLDDSPIGSIVAGVVGNSLQRLARGDRAGSLDVELIGNLPPQEVCCQHMAFRDSSYE